MNIQGILLKLLEHWSNEGCYLASGYDCEVGAGTMTPDTFFRILGQKPWKVAYWQPSRRPADGRYGDNPNRVQKHNQFQVILKPVPENSQELYLESLKKIGIEIDKHDIKFDEDNWASPSLGAWGLGYQIMCDGLEITQFTYFQQAGGLTLNPNSLEITYGIERLASFLEKKDSIYDLNWSPDVSYHDLRKEEEKQFSIYNFEEADIPFLRKCFQIYEKECLRLIGKELYLPAYDYILKCSHTFNLLDARKAISVTERTSLLHKIRSLAGEVAKIYLKRMEKEGRDA